MDTTTNTETAERDHDEDAPLAMCYHYEHCGARLPDRCQAPRFRR